MTGKRVLYWWLNCLKDEGKDVADPTYLMQAFSLTRQKALEVIEEWQVCQSKGAMK